VDGIVGNAHGVGGSTYKIGMELRLISAGEFDMGSLDSYPAACDDKPRHKVRITQPCYLGIYPVTQGEYQQVVGSNPSHFGGSDRLPVETVSWLDAVALCNALSQKEGLKPHYHIQGDRVTVPDWRGRGYRLPTEAEWEYACRAGAATR
jgi:formylglycine-generating enzyme required for sulfatase activity